MVVPVFFTTEIEALDAHVFEQIFNGFVGNVEKWKLNKKGLGRHWRSPRFYFKRLSFSLFNFWFLIFTISFRKNVLLLL